MIGVKGRRFVWHWLLSRALKPQWSMRKRVGCLKQLRWRGFISISNIRLHFSIIVETGRWDAGGYLTWRGSSVVGEHEIHILGVVSSNLTHATKKTKGRFITPSPLLTVRLNKVAKFLVYPDPEIRLLMINRQIVMIYACFLKLNYVYLQKTRFGLWHIVKLL